MANRFPLVLDTTDNNKIKEIQSGDNLNLTGNSITGVQNITAIGTIDAADIRVAGNRIVAQAFNDLTDTPSTFIGAPNYFVKVKADGTGLEYRPLSDLGNIEIDTITVDNRIVPSTSGQGYVGTVASKFNEVVATTLKGNLRSFDGTLVFNADTAKISYAALEGAPTFLSNFTDDVGYLRTTDLDTQIAGLFDDGVPFETDVVGSVFGDDSSILVDGVNNIITGNILTSDATITLLTATQVNTTAAAATTVTGLNGNLNIKGGGSTYDIVIGDDAQAETKDVVIYNAKLPNVALGLSTGIGELTASTDLAITAGNRVKILGGVPFRFSSTTTADQLAIAAQEGDVIYNTTTSRLQMYQGGSWLDVSGNVNATAGTSNFNNVTVAGNLTVTGTTTNVETTNTNITDNVITLNQGETGAGVTLGTSGIEINRGTEANKTFVWDETTDKWTLGAETLVAATVEAAFTGNLTGNTQGIHTGAVVGDVTGNASGNHTGTFDGDVTGTMSGDDSTILVDGINNKVVGDIETASLRTSESKIALGEDAGETNQGSFAIAIGYSAGETDQESWATAVGFVAGTNTQGDRATAIGSNSGQVGQGAGAVAIGAYAGQNGQGADAVAIGKNAGHTNQAANSIVINATGVTAQNSQASSLVIKPVRNASSANVMMYDPSNGEVTHTATPGTLAADIDQAIVEIGASTATTINIGNAGSTTTINGTISLPSVVAGSITADDSMSITTATGDGNAISIGPLGTNRAVNLTADVIRISGDVILPIVAKAGVVGDLKGSVVGDDSTILVDGVNSIIPSAVISGTEATNWNTAYGWGDHSTQNYVVSGTADAITATMVNENVITTRELADGNIYNGTFTGDVTGSVFADDSSIIIDGTTGTIVGPISRIVGDVQQISGPGDISLETLVTEITTTGADAYALADGVLGQVKIIAMIVDGGDATVTPTTLATGTTITFSDVNDNITLLFTSNGWLNTANQNATIA